MSLILFIEPQNEASANPVIDRYTIKMFNALLKCQGNKGCLDRGQYRRNTFVNSIEECSCGMDYHPIAVCLGADLLGVHLLAMHRAEVPAEELAKVAALEYSENISAENLIYLKASLNDLARFPSNKRVLSVEDFNETYMNQMMGRDV